MSRMEPHSRRNRRGRCHSQCFIPPPEPSMVSKFINSIQTYLIAAALIVLIFMMMEYHCKTCTANCDLQKISKSIEEIAVNLSNINKNYQALEKKVLAFSQELPKVEGQIEVLEALANTIECGGYGWNPNKHLALPNVDVYLTRPIQKIQKLQKNCTNNKPVKVSCKSKTVME